MNNEIRPSNSILRDADNKLFEMSDVPISIYVPEQAPMFTCVMCQKAIPENEANIEYDETTNSFIGKPTCSEECLNRYEQCAGLDGN